MYIIVSLAHENIEKIKCTTLYVVRYSCFEILIKRDSDGSLNFLIFTLTLGIMYKLEVLRYIFNFQVPRGAFNGTLVKLHTP